MHSHHEEPMEHQGPHAARAAGARHHAGMEEEFRAHFIVSALLTIPVMLLSPMLQDWLGYSLAFRGDRFLLWGLASIIVLWGAWPFFRGAAQSLPTGTLDMNVLVALAVGVGYLFSTAATFFFPAPEFYAEISTLVVFLLFGHWMEMRSVRTASGALQELIKLIPPTANRLVGGEIERVPTEELQKGDRLLVRPGEQVPIDGVVDDGESEVNEALVTGESRPVAKHSGDAVIGGTLNGSGAFRMRVTAVGSETAIARIIDLINRAQAAKTRTERLADRAAHYLTLAALVVGITAFLYWLVIAKIEVVNALLYMVSVFIIACPHALGLAIPTVVIIASTLGARAGILIRNNQASETSTHLDTVVFDKTGTLTRGEFGVTDIVVMGDLRENRLLAIAAAVETNSEHSIARGILRSAEYRHLDVPSTRDFRAIPGKGAQARVDETLVAVGNQALMQQFGIPTEGASAQIDQLTNQGKTVVYLAQDGRLAGIIALADIIREESYQAVRELKRLGLRVAMLTGDHENVAAHVASALGMDTYFAEVQPERKAEIVRSLQQGGKRVAMVGDGINDAPALVQADVGIAIGAGTQVAIESADVVLVRNDPRDVVSLLRLSQVTARKMVQNLLWATGYNVVAIPLAAGVLAPYGIILRPEWAALIMAASSIIVVLNALLLRRARILPHGAIVPARAVAQPRPATGESGRRKAA